MTAARAGHAFLRADNQDAYDAWAATLTIEDQEVLFAVRKARDFAVHRDGAEIGVHQPFTYVPTPGDFVHTLHLEAIDGTRKAIPAVSACSRYLGLLRSRLGVA
jgi:hypothetical protein